MVPVPTRSQLELLVRFVNTHELETGLDSLDRGWLREHGLLDAAPGGGEDELGDAVDVREAIRSLLAANNGLEADVAEASATLERAARRSGLHVRFGPDGTANVEPAAGGVDRAVGRILAVVAAAIGTEDWTRVKACRWDVCRWAFLDDARNRSRSWCSMEVCGNRAKAKAFRARRSAKA